MTQRLLREERPDEGLLFTLDTAASARASGAQKLASAFGR